MGLWVCLKAELVKKMSDTEYKLIVRLVNNRARAGGEFTSIDVNDDFLEVTGNFTNKNFNQVQHALATASRNKQIFKVRDIQNPNRKGGNMFVWSGQAPRKCQACGSIVTKPVVSSRDGSNLTKWV